jgi:hypothetical protein
MDGDSCAGATGGAVPQTSLPQAVCFSPDGRRLASISLDNGHTLTLWDWRSGARLAEQRTQPGAPPAVYGVVWSAFEPSRLASFGQNHIRFHCLQAAGCGSGDRPGAAGAAASAAVAAAKSSSSSVQVRDAV